MQAHTVERVESWGSSPFTGGVRELRTLADNEFSGAVVADGAWLFMLNGRVVGVFEGDVDDFDTSGTVYQAPHPSLPLLFSMQERGGETQAKYYTNDTPVSEADETLTDANFTGYIELSENVLSGDYYVVYHGGRSMSAAFVGASGELIAGDEAFERADDEVGVYEVKKVPVNVTSLPEPDEPEPDDANGAAAGATAGAEVADDATAEDDAVEASESDADESREDDTPEGGAPEGGTPEEGPPEEDAVTESGAAAESADERAAAEKRGGKESARSSAASGDGGTAASAATADESAGALADEQEWQNARSVPTLDPKRSATDGNGGGSTSTGSASSSTRSKSASASKQSGGSRRNRVEKLKRAVEQRNEKLEEAKERIDALEGERDDLREQLAEVREERDRLRATVSELEAEDASGESGLTPDAALADTNLFVRYDSKGKPTLDELDRETDPDAVNENLRIEHHTQFDAASATVDGEEFESFLTASNVHRFVQWTVRELPYEIRDSGHATGLADLFAALPQVDRAELDGTVEADTEEGSVSRTFDVVLRDRMGNALVVAELNDGRDAVTGDQMASLVDAATEVSEYVESLSAAMYVTASFFEPQALETASESTDSGGFLSRSDKESYVKVARKDGYHLCLVEDRNDAFHLTVPEL